MAADTPATSVSWRVVSQQETSEPGANGTYTKGVLVYFLLSSGANGSVFIPDAQYSIDNVKAAVAARAAQIASVGALTSD